MKFFIEIDSEGAQATEDPKGLVITAIRGIVLRIENGQTAGQVNDINGNRVGTWALEL